MNWITQMNAAVQYIEDHLEDEINYEELSKIACCSVFHFQKIFSIMTNIPLGEYIRRRRLSLAAFELQNFDVKIIDLAMKYGYQSPTAFNRAFQNMHHISPSDARTRGAVITTYSPLSFQIIIKGVTEMKYKIVEKDAFRIIGEKLHTTMENEESLKAIPEFWGKAHQEGLIPRLLPLMDMKNPGVMGVSVMGSSENVSEFDYYIAVASNAPLFDHLCEYMIRKYTWAVFECVGPMPTAIQDLQQRIITEWLPNSGYEYDNAPDIEVYGEGDMSSPEYRCEVWLPVIKK